MEGGWVSSASFTVFLTVGRWRGGGVEGKGGGGWREGG